jgi:prepilin-type N-terminal cleavage/methylation domain-containing protein
MSNHRISGTRLHSRHDGFSFMELVVVLAVAGTLAAIALPTINKTLASMRLNGAARSISNQTAVTKTKAAAQFSRARLYADLGAGSFHLEVWNAVTNQWDVDGGTTTLPVNAAFGFGAVGAPPNNTQPAIAQAPACLANAVPPALPAPIANTACIVFNSRGIPIDAALAPTASDALYITDGTSVLGVTVAATGLIGLWTTPAAVAPSWTIS